MIERKFVNKGIRNSELDEYFQKELDRVDYSYCEIQRTPLNTRILIHAGRPGMVIGRGGSKIQEMTTTIEERFKIEKPQLEVKALENVDLDARVISKQIASAIEKGMKHKRIVSVYLKKIMNAGALGVEIIIAGKISGERKRTEKFQEGYIKKAGFPAVDLVSKGNHAAILKAGIIGVDVRIMKDIPAIMKIGKNIKEFKNQINAEKKKTAEIVEEKADEKETKEEKLETKKTTDKAKDDTDEIKKDDNEKKATAVKKETVKKDAETKTKTVKKEKPTEAKKEEKPAKKDTKKTETKKTK